MKDRLEQYFGCEVKISEYEKELRLPIFMTMREIKLVELFGVSFALINIVKELELTVGAMKKQQKQYEEALQCPVAYEAAVNSLGMRNAMVKNGIAFIDLSGNVFLPFLGTVLLDVYRKQRVRRDKMMPATQLVFLELLYMEEGRSVLKSELAARLKLTKTSVTRATAQLEEMGLISQHKSGTEIWVKRNDLPRKYYEKARPYLISPVQKVLTVFREKEHSKLWKAGETALSLGSELNPPVIEELAVYKGAEITGQLKAADARYEAPAACVKIQLWKYDPACFARNGRVDPVSLACSFEGNEDERIEMSIEKQLEEI